MRTINIRNRKKIIIIVTICIIFVVLLIILVSLYLSQKNYRNWIDINVFRKNVSEQDIQSINLNTDKNNQIHVYNNYISVLNDKTVTLYNSYGEKITSIEVNINSAIFDSSQKYFAIAENNGHEICLIFDKTYLWSEKLEGEILQIHVNRNGYIATVSTDATHKSIVTFFNSQGKKLFTSYFASTRIVDASISNDNKYIAIGELDTSGTIIKSNIKVLSVQNAQQDAENTIIYTYKDVIKIENDSITYLANDFNNHVAYVDEESTGLFKAQSNVHIINTSDFQEKLYKMDYIAKDVYANDNIIAINVGTEIYFVDTNGWLIKKYTSNQEITNIKFSEKLATVIFKDRIVIINL